MKTEHLAFSYEENSEKKVLEDVNIEIGEGSFVAILGHNGSGKSTLAKHFNAILLPMGGKVYAAGFDTSEEAHVFNIRRNVGMVFQNPDNQLVATIVEEDVAFALENLGVPPAEIRMRVDEALKTVGMYEYRLSSPHQLSGGQKQRVAVAGILAMRPRCIVLDEPTAMLDPKGRKEVVGVVEKLSRSFGITVVLITHYMDEAARADRIIVMNDGKILCDGTPREIFSQAALLKSVGLSVPQSTQLIDLLKEKGIDLPAGITNPTAAAEAIIQKLSLRKAQREE